MKIDLTCPECEKNHKVEMDVPSYDPGNKVFKKKLKELEPKCDCGGVLVEREWGVNFKGHPGGKVPWKTRNTDPVDDAFKRKIEAGRESEIKN